MLVAGYLGETFVVGTFVMTFSIIYKEMNGAGKGITAVAFMLPNAQKNVLPAVLLTNEILA